MKRYPVTVSEALRQLPRWCMASVLSVVFLAPFLAGCAYDSEAKKRDAEEDRTLYLLLTRPTADQASAACATAEDRAVSCAGPIMLAAAYQPTLTGFYGTAITGTDGATICSQIYSASMFRSTNPTITEGAKLCHAECNRLYWQNREASCASDYATLLNDFMLCSPGIWMTQCTYPSMKACLRDCFITGTPIWQIP